MQAAQHIEIQGLLQELRTPDTAVLRAAEARFSELRATRPSELVLALVSAISNDGAPQQQEFAAVLLRKIITRDKTSVYVEISPDARVALKEGLLQVAQRETSASLRRRVASTISGLGLIIMEDNGWPELMPFLFHSATGGSSQLRECALSIFADLSYFVGTFMKGHLQTVSGVFEQNLAAEMDPSVRTAAVRAVTSLVLVLEHKEERQVFQHLLGPLLSALADMVQQRRDDDVQDVMQDLIEFAEEQAKFFRPQVAQLVPFLVEMTHGRAPGNPGVRLETHERLLALELLMALAEGAPAMLRKLPDEAFLRSTVPAVLQLLLETADKQYTPAQDERWASKYEEREERVDLNVGLHGLLGAADSGPAPGFGGSGGAHYGGGAHRDEDDEDDDDEVGTPFEAIRNDALAAIDRVARPGSIGPKRSLPIMFAALDQLLVPRDLGLDVSLAPTGPGAGAAVLPLEMTAIGGNPREPWRSRQAALLGLSRVVEYLPSVRKNPAPMDSVGGDWHPACCRRHAPETTERCNLALVSSAQRQRKWGTRDGPIPSRRGGCTERDSQRATRCAAHQGTGGIDPHVLL